ncbi:MAG: hypothetical protein ACOYW4_11115 [Bacillota bacterium]
MYPVVTQGRSPAWITLVEKLLVDKRSQATRRVYRWDLEHFFLSTTGEFPSRENVAAFLALPRAKATAVVLDYCRRAGIHKPMSPHKMRQLCHNGGSGRQ